MTAAAPQKHPEGATGWTPPEAHPGWANLPPEAQRWCYEYSIGAFASTEARLGELTGAFRDFRRETRAQLEAIALAVGAQRVATEVLSRSSQADPAELPTVVSAPSDPPELRRFLGYFPEKYRPRVRSLVGAILLALLVTVALKLGAIQVGGP